MDYGINPFFSLLLEDLFFDYNNNDYANWLYNVFNSITVFNWIMFNESQDSIYVSLL